MQSHWVGRYPFAMKRTLIALALALIVPFASSQVWFDDWLFLETVDPITDQVSASLIAYATEAPPLTDNPAIYVLCSEDRRILPFISFNAGKFLTLDSDVEVVFRVDTETPYSSDWIVLRSLSAVTARGEARNVLMSQLYDAQRLVFRIEAFRETLTYFVPVSGLREAVTATGCYTGFGAP